MGLVVTFKENATQRIKHEVQARIFSLDEQRLESFEKSSAIL